VSLHLLYGGTFDPVHHGHLAVARAARDALGTRVALMPAADPPHRPPPGASAEQRAAMLDLAVLDEPGLYVDRRELGRDEPSYSVETLRALRSEIGGTAAVALLVGADSFRDLPAWRDWRTLFSLAHFVVAERADNPLADDLAGALAVEAQGRWAEEGDALLASPGGRILRLHQPLHPASATGIRQRIAAGLPWRDAVPVAVAEYIERHGLYRDGPGKPPSL
jgi:nicotinate-nucleotide adenylyltransferase